MSEEQTISEIPSNKPEGLEEISYGSNKNPSAVSNELIIGIITKVMQRIRDDICKLGELKSKRACPCPELDHFLHVHRLLKKSFYFCTVTKLKIQGGYHSDAEILKRHNEMFEALRLLRDLLIKEGMAKTFLITSEKNFLLSFYDSVQAHIYQTVMRKIISEIWYYIRDNQRKEIGTESKIIYNNLRLSLYGLELPSNNPDDYPLHKAILEEDFSEVMKYVNYKCDFAKIFVGLNSSDPIGNTPLTLAVKIGRLSFVNFLVEKGASPKVQTHEFRRNAIEEAILCKNKEILKILLLGALDEDQETLLSQHQIIDELLSTIPDFSCKFKWEVDSKIIPFVRRWAPSDVYSIYKKGRSLRIDFSLYHWSKLKSVRRRQSLLFNAKPSANRITIDEKINLLFIDHEAQKYQNVLDQKLSPSVFEKRVDYLIENRDINQERNLSINDWVFAPARNWRGLLVKEQINNMSTTKYNAKGSFTISSKDKEIVIDPEKEKIIIKEKFEDYFKKAIAASSWKGFKQREDSFDRLIEFLGKLDTERKEKKSKTSKKTTKDYFFSKEEGMSAEDDLTTHGGTLRKGENKSMKKQLQSEIWLAQNVPLKIQHLMPIFDVIATNSEDILQVKNFLQSHFLQEIELFPVKCIFPLLLSFFLTIEISDISFNPIDDSKFQMDPNIKKDQSVLIEKPNKSAEEDQSMSALTKISKPNANMYTNNEEISMASSMEIPEESEFLQKNGRHKSKTQLDPKIQETSLFIESGENFDISSEEGNRELSAKREKSIFKSDLLSYTKEKKTLREVYFQNNTQNNENIYSEPSESEGDRGWSRVFNANNRNSSKF